MAGICWEPKAIDADEQRAVARFAIFAYFTSWSIYERGFNLWEVDPCSITHLAYAFAAVNEDGWVALKDPYADIEKRNIGYGDSESDPDTFAFGNLHQLFRLKQMNSTLKTGLSIGGWGEGNRFRLAASTADSRGRFVQSTVALVENLGLDFVDLDWEFPEPSDMSNLPEPSDMSNLPEPSDMSNLPKPSDMNNLPEPNDMNNLLQLVADLRTARPSMQLSAAVSCSTFYYRHLPIRQLSRYLDYFVLMGYNFTGSWSEHADHHSNLYGKANSVDKAVRHYILSGARPEQLVLGIPLYAKTFPACHGLGKPFDRSKSTDKDYRLVMDKCRAVGWDQEAGSSSYYDTDEQTVYCLDTLESVEQKIGYIKRNGLGGAMVWELSQDLPLSNPMSLLAAINQGFGSEKECSLNCRHYPHSIYLNIQIHWSPTSNNGMGNHQSGRLEMANPISSESAASLSPPTQHRADRPSDEEILRHEQHIKETEVDTTPIVSGPLPIAILRIEYENGALGFQQKLRDLEAAYTHFRKCRGDGNCFFRAFGFGLIEAIGRAAEPASVGGLVVDRCREWLERSGFEKLAYEDFFDEFVSTLDRFYACSSVDPIEWLASEWQNQEYRSNAVVVLLRMVTSAFLRIHAETYEPFICDAVAPLANPHSKQPSPMELFCQRFVESIGQESDQIHVIAMSKALGCTVRIAYLDGNEETGRLCYHELGATEPEDRPIGALCKIHLLYRPGHYDVLYKN